MRKHKRKYTRRFTVATFKLTWKMPENLWDGWIRERRYNRNQRTKK